MPIFKIWGEISWKRLCDGFSVVFLEDIDIVTIQVDALFVINRGKQYFCRNRILGDLVWGAFFA